MHQLVSTSPCGFASHCSSFPFASLRLRIIGLPIQGQQKSFFLQELAPLASPVFKHLKFAPRMEWSRIFRMAERNSCLTLLRYRERERIALPVNLEQPLSLHQVFDGKQSLEAGRESVASLS